MWSGEPGGPKIPFIYQKNAVGGVLWFQFYDDHEVLPKLAGASIQKLKAYARIQIQECPEPSSPQPPRLFFNLLTHFNFFFQFFIFLAVADLVKYR